LVEASHDETRTRETLTFTWGKDQACRGAAVAWRSGVVESQASPLERRRTARADRRRNPRSGRRTGDPHVNWRRVAWLCAAYAVYLSVRSLPTTV